MKPAIEVTGLGCVCAAGKSLDETIEAFLKTPCEPTPPVMIEADLKEDFPVFEITWIGEQESAPTRTTHFLKLALEEALRQSELTARTLRQLRVGVCIGTTVGCTLNNEPFYRQFLKGELPEVTSLRRYQKSNPALWLSQQLGLNGPAATVANACTAGADAIGLAKAWLEADLCDIAIAGGADELSRLTYIGFASLLILSPAACRPFSADRSGLNLGEGAGLMVLEKGESSQGRSVGALAELTGYGTSSDAYHATAPHPEGLGLQRAIDQALSQSGISAAEIGFINAHGTATPDNDRVEGRVLQTLFPEALPVVSTKSCVGHTLGASGGLEAVFTVRALQDQLLTPTRRFAQYDPECGITPTTEAVELNSTYGLSSSLAFGGNNSVLLFRKVS